MIMTMITMIIISPNSEGLNFKLYHTFKRTAISEDMTILAYNEGANSCNMPVKYITTLPAQK